MQLWTSADIAKELGVSASVVANWSYYGRDYIPTPTATTQAGTKLWTDAQAKEIIGGYYRRKEAKAQRKAEKAREQRVLERLNI